MFSLFRNKLLFTASFVLVVGFAGSTFESGPLNFTICAEPESLPLSQQSSRSGFEIEVAELLAQDMNLKLEIKWVAQRDHSYFRQTLGSGQCDAIMSVPSQMGRFSVSQPWYRTGFVFVTRAEDKINLKSFDDPLLAKLKIGIPATGLGETPPALAMTRRGLTKNLRPYSIYEPASLISAVAQKQVDVAFVWGPFAGWLAVAEKNSLSVQATPDRDGVNELAYDVSVGVRKGNDVLLKKINLALDHQRGAIAASLAKWHVPLRPL